MRTSTAAPDRPDPFWLDAIRAVVFPVALVAGACVVAGIFIFNLIRKDRHANH